MAFSGAMIRKTYPGDQAIAHQSNTFVTFGVVDYDYGGWWNPNYPTRLTVPEGITKVKVHGQCIWQLNASGLRQIVLKKNGAFYPGDPCVNVVAAGGTTTDIDAHSPMLEVQAGDYFEMEVFQNSGAPLNLLVSTGTYLAIEAVA